MSDCPRCLLCGRDLEYDLGNGSRYIRAHYTVPVAVAGVAYVCGECGRPPADLAGAVRRRMADTP